MSGYYRLRDGRFACNSLDGVVVLDAYAYVEHLLGGQSDRATALVSMLEQNTVALDAPFVTAYLQHPPFRLRVLHLIVANPDNSRRSLSQAILDSPAGEGYKENVLQAQDSVGPPPVYRIPRIAEHIRRMSILTSTEPEMHDIVITEVKTPTIRQFKDLMPFEHERAYFDDGRTAHEGRHLVFSDLLYFEIRLVPNPAFWETLQSSDLQELRLAIEDYVARDRLKVTPRDSQDMFLSLVEAVQFRPNRVGRAPVPFEDLGSVMRLLFEYAPSAALPDMSILSLDGENNPAPMNSGVYRVGKQHDPTLTTYVFTHFPCTFHVTFQGPWFDIGMGMPRAEALDARGIGILFGGQGTYYDNMEDFRKAVRFFRPCQHKVVHASGRFAGQPTLAALPLANGIISVPAAQLQSALRLRLVQHLLIVSIDPRPFVRYETTISEENIDPRRRNDVSAHHCQDGTSKSVYLCRLAFPFSSRNYESEREKSKAYYEL